jgi:hypothetical protein
MIILEGISEEHDLSNANLSAMAIHNQVAFKANFFNSNLAKTNVEDCEFIACSFTRANMNNMLFSNCKFMGVDFSNSNLFNSKFLDSEIIESSFSGTNLEKVEFENCDICATPIAAPNFSSVNFKNTHIAGEIVKVNPVYIFGYDYDIFICGWYIHLITRKSGHVSRCEIKEFREMEYGLVPDDFPEDLRSLILPIAQDYLNRHIDALNSSREKKE